MPISYIRKNHFAGSGRVFGREQGSLEDILRRVMQYQTAVAMGTSLTALTDNSGGIAANATAGFGLVSYGVLSGTNMAQKAELETAFDLVKDALTETGAKVLAAFAVIPGTPLNTITNSIGGAAADGTIAALDVSMTAVNTSIAATSGTRTVVSDIVKLMKQQTYHLNLLARAVGVSELVDDIAPAPLGTVPVYTTTYAALATTTGTAVSGADATVANGGVTKAEADVLLVKMANYVAKLAAKANAIQSFCDTPTLRALSL